MGSPGNQKCIRSFILAVSICLSQTLVAHEQDPAAGAPDGQAATRACFPLTTNRVKFKIDRSDIKDHVAVNSWLRKSYITIKMTSSSPDGKHFDFELGFGRGVSGDWPSSWKGVCQSGKYELKPANSSTAKIDTSQKCEHEPTISMYKDSGQRQIDITIGSSHGGGANGGKGCKEHEKSASHSKGGPAPAHNGVAHGGE